jgi:hypothetical protein
MDSYSALSTFSFFALIPLLLMAAIYILGIVTMVYLIKALRIYINKNKTNNNNDINSNNNNGQL